MEAVEGKRWTKNPKTRRIMELLDQEKGRVKLMWIPSHSRITGNERADEAANNALDEDINDRELYPPQDLIGWIRKTDAKNRQKRKHHEIQKRNYRVEGRFHQPKQNEQVVVSRLRMMHTRATHIHVIEKRHYQNTPFVRCR
jgi:hypothetical protein